MVEGKGKLLVEQLVVKKVGDSVHEKGLYYLGSLKVVSKVLTMGLYLVALTVGL